MCTSVQCENQQCTHEHILISALHWYHLTLIFAIRYCSVQSLFVEFRSLRPSLYFQASADPGDMNYDDWCFLSPPKITSFPRSPPTIKLITLTRSLTGGFEPGCQKSVTGSPCSKSGPRLEELACDQIHRHLPSPSVHSLENTIETDGVKLSTPPLLMCYLSNSMSYTRSAWPLHALCCCCCTKCTSLCCHTNVHSANVRVWHMTMLQSFFAASRRHKSMQSYNKMFFTLQFTAAMWTCICHPAAQILKKAAVCG